MARGRGIGTAILHAVIATAADRGATIFRSEVAIGNAGSLALHANARLRVGRVAFSVQLGESVKEHNDAWLQESADTVASLAERLKAAAIRRQHEFE